MGSDVSVPKPSAEEKALQAEQTALLREQRNIISDQYKQQQLLSPILFDQLGITPEFDPDTGEITGYNKVQSEKDKLSEEVELGFLQRSKDALAGNLPVSPTLERELIDAEQTLNERLRRQLGPGYATSTPGTEALQKFGQSGIELREAARRGELTLAEQLGLARGGFNANQVNQTLSGALGINSGALQSAGMGINLANAFGQQVGQYQNNRALQLQASTANAQYGTFAQLMSAFGTAAGIGAGVAFG